MILFFVSLLTVIAREKKIEIKRATYHWQKPRLLMEKQYHDPVHSKRQESHLLFEIIQGALVFVASLFVCLF